MPAMHGGSVGEVVDIGCVTLLPIAPSRVLSAADKEAEDFDQIVILGWKKDGNFYFSASEADGAKILWLLEVARIRLLDPDG